MALRRGECSFAGINLDAIYVFTDASEAFITAERDIEFVEVPGKDGAVAFDNGRFKNVTIPVEVFFKNDLNYEYKRLMDKLYTFTGYQKLRLPFATGEFRLAVFHSAVTFESGPWLKSGRATLYFNCKPFWYYDSGDEWKHLIIPSTIHEATYPANNGTSFNSKPLFRLDGDCQVYIDDVRYFAINGLKASEYEYVDIDSETMTVSCGEANLSQYVRMPYGFPELTKNADHVVKVVTDNSVTYTTNLRFKTRLVHL